VTTFDIIWRFLVLQTFVVVYLCFLEGFGVPHPDVVSVTAANRVTDTPHCDLTHGEFEFALFAVEALMLAYGAYLTNRTQGVPDAVNESAYVTKAMMIIIGLCIIIIPVEYATPLDRVILELVAGLGFAMAVISSECIIFIPKALILLSGHDMDRDMKVQRKARAQVFAVGNEEDLGDLNARFAEYKDIVAGAKKALKACKNSEDKYALAQAQVAWWRAQAMNFGEANSGASGSSHSNSNSNSNTSANSMTFISSHQVNVMSTGDSRHTRGSIHSSHSVNNNSVYENRQRSIDLMTSEIKRDNKESLVYPDEGSEAETVVHIAGDGH
jgi:7 transmembrane sweet-taste receptor of 3 GCPR